VTLHDCRDAFAATLIDLAERDPRIVAVVNDSVGSSKLGEFQRRFPDRLINVGIAEQAMVGVAAGLSAGGFIPFVSAASCFLTARAMEQIKVDIAYSERHVILCGQSPGVAYGELGPTHHSVEDLAWLRAIPGLTVLVPADPTETSAAIRWAASHPGPSFVRVSRMAVPDVHEAGRTFEPGVATVLREGSDVTLAAMGTTVARALAAADELAGRGISARVLSMGSLAPLDSAALLAAARETGAVVTVEESLVSGLGGAVAEVLSEGCPVPLRRLGMRDFAPTGSAQWLMERSGLAPEGIAAAAAELVAAGGRVA
jgi:transketolase